MPLSNPNLGGHVRVEHNVGAVGGAAFGTQVTTGAASGTKGTPAQIFAATAFDAFFVHILFHNHFVAATLTDCMADILIGAATEEVLIANLMAGYCAASGAELGPKSFMFPLYIPAGSRIAVQAAGLLTANATLRCSMFLYGGVPAPWLPCGSKVTTYGISSVPTGATAITPGASAAEGAYAQIVAATSEDHIALIPGFGPTGDTTLSSKTLMVDIGLGAATEEQVAESFIFQTSINESCAGPLNPFPAFLDIPSGTRLAMRASNNGANDGGYQGALYAVSQ